MNINRDGKAFGEFCARRKLYRHEGESVVAEALFAEVGRLNEEIEKLKAAFLKWIPSDAQDIDAAEPTRPKRGRPAKTEE